MYWVFVCSSLWVFVYFISGYVFVWHIFVLFFCMLIFVGVCVCFISGCIFVWNSFVLGVCMFIFVGFCVFDFRIYFCLKYCCIGFLYVQFYWFLCLLCPDILLFDVFVIVFWMFFVGLCVYVISRLCVCLKYVCIVFLYVHVCRFLCIWFPYICLFEICVYWVFVCSCLWVFVSFIS